jgi:hypothetical protein
MTALTVRPFRRTALVLVVLGVLVAAFETYAWTTRQGGPHLRRGGSAFAVVPSASPVAADPATTAAGAEPSGSASPAAAATVRPSPVASSALSGTSGAAGTGASDRHAVSAAPAGGAPVTPRPGSYRLAVDGKEKVDFGPVSFCSRALPTETALVVSPAQGETAGSFDFDIRYFPGSAGQHDERHIYRYAAETVDLTYENATVTCGGVQQTSQVDYSPPQIRVQLPLRVGAGWSSTGGDSSRTEAAQSKVLRVENVAVAGTAVKTYVIETRVDVTGSETGSRLQRWWYAPSLALPVKWFEHIDGSRSGATYSEDATITVVGLP